MVYPLSPLRYSEEETPWNKNREIADINVQKGTIGCIVNHLIPFHALVYMSCDIPFLNNYLHGI